MDFSKMKHGERVATKFSIIGMSTKAIAKSQFGNVGKWSLDVIGHPTSGSGTVAMTENELTVLAKKLGLSSWKSLIPVLNKGVVQVETTATFNKKGSAFKNEKTGASEKYSVDHLRFNVNDYVVTPDAQVRTFVDAQQSALVAVLERETLESNVDLATKNRNEVLRIAAGLQPKAEEAEI